MKKTLILPALALVFSCAQEAEMPMGHKAAVRATVPDFVEEPGSRTTITPTATGMSFAWAEGDQLAIYGPSGKTMTNFDIDATTISTDAKTADFENCEFALRKGSTYFAVYPKDYSQLRAATFAVNYQNQRQTSDGSTTHLAKIDYLTSSAAVTTENSCNFTFSHLGAIIRIKVNVNTETNVKSLSLTAENNVFTTAGTVDLTVATPTVTSTATSHTVTLLLGEGNDGLDVNGTLTAYLMTPPVNLVGDNLTLSVATDGDTYTFPLTGKDIKAGNAFAYSVNLVKHEFVDLGLPSGTKWATMNVGASTPEDYGNYFAWGETTGYPKTDLSHAFDWTNYAFSNGSSTSLTKYCYSSDYGSVDTLTELATTDDAARAQWGEHWRMPSAEQYQELANASYTSSELLVQGGVFGRKITSLSNGNSIFFPAAGYRNASQLEVDGEDGYYWSRDLGSTNSSGAKYFYFSEGSMAVFGGRSYGFTVRPVYVP